MWVAPAMSKEKPFSASFASSTGPGQDKSQSAITDIIIACEVTIEIEATASPMRWGYSSTSRWIFHRQNPHTIAIVTARTTRDIRPGTEQFTHVCIVALIVYDSPNAVQSRIPVHKTPSRLQNVAISLVGGN